MASEVLAMSEKHQDSFSEHYRILEVPFGSCGIAWSQRGVTRFQLPEGGKSALRARMQREGRVEWRNALPQLAAYAEAKLQRYFKREEVDFSDLLLDLSNCTPFHTAVYDAARSIHWGRTATYGALARKVGSPRGARAVGHAMSKNPIAVIIPCHRILAAGAKIGGFSAHGGVAVKTRLLEMEGVRPGAESMRQRSLFPFDELVFSKNAH
jgi:methylated-DNA-[protein]-cysteine S-methyltransferase